MKLRTSGRKGVKSTDDGAISPIHQIKLASPPHCSAFSHNNKMMKTQRRKLEKEQNTILKISAPSEDS